MIRLLISLAIGFSATIGLYFGSGIAWSKGFPFIAKAMFWQEPFLQAFPAWHGFVSPESPIFGSLTLLGAFVLGFITYGAIAYVLLRWLAPNNSFKPTPLRGAA